MPSDAQATRLVELLDEAKERCKGTIKERRGDDISAEELDESSSIMGYGAIKYADLKNNRKTDYKCAAADPALMALWPHPFSSIQLMITFRAKGKGSSLLQGICKHCC